MASMDLLGLWIESGSGLLWFEYFVIAYVTYDWYIMMLFLDR
jgi:hypothetical protein